MPYRGGELFPLSTLIAHIDDPNQASSLIQTIFPLLSPAQKEFLLADAQATVARLDAQEAAP